MEVYLINDTTSYIQIEDLHGVAILPEEKLNILDLYPYEWVTRSLDLKTYVYNGEIIVNDGLKDLSIEDGLEQLESQTVYEARHKLENHTDVPAPNNNFDQEVLVSDGTSYIWLNYFKHGHGQSPASGISFTMSDHQNHDYVACATDTYTNIRSFVYAGTEIWTPSKFSVVGSLSNTTTGYARLFDYTHSNIICEVSWTSLSKIIIASSNLLNLPNEYSIIELQIKVENRGRDARLHYMAFY